MPKEILCPFQAETKWPGTGLVEIEPEVDFVYIMRKDANFAMNPIAEKACLEYNLDILKLKTTLLDQYDNFFAKLCDTLKWAFSSKGNIQLHVFESEDLDQGVRSKAGKTPLISLDPLMHTDVYEHRVSRGYYLGGKKDFGQVARPGSKSLLDQAQYIANILAGSKANVVEDDIFSGGSIIASLNALLSFGINIDKVIAGIQVGNPEKIIKMGINVDPVVEYKTSDHTNIFDKVDLGDPRDYLLGASGLVTKLPSGNYGRAPYILPFVSTTARAGIPSHIEKEFGRKILRSSLGFFDGVKSTIRHPLLLKHMDPNFALMMHEVYSLDLDSDMSDVTSWLIENMDELWQVTQDTGEFQEKLDHLELPQNIVLLDVNGTLFADESKDGYISDTDLATFSKVVDQVRSKGVSVGLCSDSPLTQLQEFAKKINLDGPIVAENGSILAYNDKVLFLNTLEKAGIYKDKIARIATELGYIQMPDTVSIEFGGKPLHYKSNEWAFGAGRDCSISVFAPENLVQKISEVLNQDQSEISIDFSPQYNYFAIHSGKNYKENKGITLNLLSKYGYKLMMVGNSMSDWVDPAGGVTCAFVTDSKINLEKIGSSVYISPQATIKGVIDILQKIL